MPTVLVIGPTTKLVVLAVTIAITHFAYPRRDDQAELACVAWLNTKTVYPRAVTHLSTNPARRRVTSLMCPTTLPLNQTAKKNMAAWCSGNTLVGWLTNLLTVSRLDTYPTT